ncbi:MAG: type I-B CRISPR-associated protein Cas7/Csh2 [Firmicutes bacterium]|nr:type I-B CRISPR-associated protein Cas7/Csh2 [Bacillota bacterium]
MDKNKDLSRSEILFIYDAKDCNPNGDPLDENRPRIDPETDTNLVTDVRLKRTVRDYVHNYVFGPNQDKPEFSDKRIFIIEDTDEESGARLNVAKRAEKLGFKNAQDFLKCWDVRLFGGTLAIERKKSKGKKGEGSEEEDDSPLSSLTGPVQFHMGRSLNPVSVNALQGTSVFSSTGKEAMGSMRMEYQVFYSLIAFWGVVNPTTAIRQGIPLNGADIDLLMEALWEGTLNLTTRSKIGQMPRLLLKVNYKPEYSRFFLGELERGLKMVPTNGASPESIRSIDDYALDISSLLNRLSACEEKIESIDIRQDSEFKILPDFKPLGINKLFAGF